MSEGLLPRVFAAMITGSQRSYEHKTVSRRKQTSAPEGAEEKALLSRSFSKKRGGGLRLPPKAPGASSQKTARLVRYGIIVMTIWRETVKKALTGFPPWPETFWSPRNYQGRAAKEKVRTAGMNERRMREGIKNE